MSKDSRCGAERAGTLAYAFGFLSADSNRERGDLRLTGLSMLPTDFLLELLRGGSGGGGESVFPGLLAKAGSSMADPCER